MKPSVKEVKKIRLQVYLSHNGVCSRRKAFEIIQQGKVKVNGKVVLEPSTPVDESKDNISVRDKLIKSMTFDYILLNKSSGFVTTKSSQASQKTVFDLLPKKFNHLVPVGRLDKNTEGLLLLTNDGDLAYKLTHPKFDVDKTYTVKITGRLSAQARKRLEEGIRLEGKKTAPTTIRHVKYGANHTEFTIILHEGRKRQIRLMCSEVGYRVVNLKRIIQGPLILGTLATGKWRELNQEEIGKLKKI